MMKEIVVNQNSVLEIRHVEIPACDDDEVLVKVSYSGLCGSDIPRIFHHGAHFYPVRLGHEFSGTVVKTGNKVTQVQVGQRICCIPLIPNAEAEETKRGYHALGKGYSFIGSRKPGGNAEYVVMPQQCCYLLPDEVSDLEGAFCEPVTVGIHPLLMAGGCKGKNVIVIGVGTIGLLALQSAKALGASTITAIDVDDNKLRLAQKLGADFIIKGSETETEENQRILENLCHDQLILETAGVPATYLLAVNIAGPRAHISLVGTIHNDFSINWRTYDKILRKELSINGSWMNYSAPFPGEEWHIAMALFKENRIDVSSIIDCIANEHDYIERVMQLNGGPASGKILLRWEGGNETYYK